MRDKILRVFIAGLSVFILIIWLRFLFPEMTHAAYLYGTGQSRMCSLSETIDAASMTRRQIDRYGELTQTGTLIETADDGTELWSTISGDWWFPSGSKDAILIDLSEQDRDIYHIESDGIQPGDVVLDCGANIGLFARKAVAQGASRVISIEPAPNNLAALHKNLAAEIAAGKVTIYPKGVWDKEDVLPMYLDAENSAANTFIRERRSGKTMELPLTTVDLLVEELGLDRVDFIKLDIEGAEEKAIAGAAETIRKFKPRMALCLYHLEDDPVRLPAAVLKVNRDYEVKHACMVTREAIFPQIAHFR